MNLLRKILPVLLAAAMLLSLTGCGDTSWIVKVDGVAVNSGLYIYYQGIGYTATGYELMAENTDYYYKVMYGESYIDDTIGDQTVREYMNDYAIDMCKQYVVVERLFEELGLSIDEDSEALIKSQVNRTWDSQKDSMERAGIAKSTLEKAVTSSIKEELVFNAYYEVGGLNGTTEDDIRGYLEDNYVRVKYISIPFADSVDDAVDSERLSNAVAQAQGYLDRLNAGESMDDLIAEYEASLETEDESSEEAEASDGEETSGDETQDAEDVTVEEDPYENESVLSLDSTSPSEKFVNYAFTEVADGESKLIQDDLNVYLIQKLDILERPEIYDENRDVFLNALFDESFTSLLNERLSGYTVEENASSIKRYKAERALGLEN